MTENSVIYSIFLLRAVLILHVWTVATLENENNDSKEILEKCSSVEFWCAEGKCIPTQQVCDGIPHCLNGFDESPSVCGCAADEFKCYFTKRNDVFVTNTSQFNNYEKSTYNKTTSVSHDDVNFTCIDMRRRCDLIEDCASGHDERNCDVHTCPITHAKCANHACVPNDKLCDFVNDCGDNSDEDQCARGECYQSEWRCDNGKCINPVFLCDGVNDCIDGSDELHCDTHLRCDNGLYTSSSHVCDGWVDCFYSVTDELNCGPCADALYTCSNSRCIEKGNVCDGVCDCGHSCEDEAECGEICSSRTFVCSGSEAIRCIQPELVCDGVNHCHDGSRGSDEELCEMTGDRNCSDGICLWCENLRRNLLYSPSNSFYSQMLCSSLIQPKVNASSCSLNSNVFVCANGVCITGDQQCDLHSDCFDKSDEILCNSDRSAVCDETKHYRCKNGQCIDRHKRCDFTRDCWDGSDEHLCKKRQCRGNEFKCNNSQCIPASNRCLKLDTGGCADNSHLWNCGNFTCPQGYLKCRNSECVNSDKICDEFPDCATITDEEICEYKCPTTGRMVVGECTCYDTEMNCEYLNLTDIPDTTLEKRLTKYYLGHNMIGANFSNSSLIEHSRASVLDLRNNSIIEIQSGTFIYMFRLQALILSDNKITVLPHKAFEGLTNLKALMLNGNRIARIEIAAFIGLTQLTTLDLSYQNLEYLEKNALIGLKNLHKLKLDHNHILHIADGSFNGIGKIAHLDISANNHYLTVDKNVFNGLQKLKYLNTDSYRFCCLASAVDNCYPKSDEFSSCEDLMSNLVLRVCIWILGLLSLVGNAIVLSWRIYDTKDSKVHSHLIGHLAIADILMGLYLLTIAVVDQYYRGVYFIHDAMWRNSALCKTAGFLSTFSSELSVFTLTVITIDRFVSIIFPFRFKKMEINTARIIMACIWIICAAISVLPLFGLRYFDNFYGRSGVCLALHITEDRPNGWEYSIVVFLVLNFVSFNLILVAYMWMFVAAHRTQAAVRGDETGPQQRSNEGRLAGRMSLIVGTDFLCWMPIVLLGFSSLAGQNIPPQVYAWVAVFVLPVNSAINPILYTLSTATFIKHAKHKLFSFHAPAFLASFRRPQAFPSGGSRKSRGPLTASTRKTQLSYINKTQQNSSKDRENKTKLKLLDSDNSRKNSKKNSYDSCPFNPSISTPLKPANDTKL